MFVELWEVADYLPKNQYVDAIVGMSIAQRRDGSAGRALTAIIEESACQLLLN